MHEKHFTAYLSTRDLQKDQRRSLVTLGPTIISVELWGEEEGDDSCSVSSGLSRDTNSKQMLLVNSSIFPGWGIPLWIPLPHHASSRNNCTARSLLMAKERVEQRDHRKVYLEATLWGLEDGALTTVVGLF